MRARSRQVVRAAANPECDRRHMKSPLPVGQARSAWGSWAPPVPSVVSAANPERDRRHMKSPLPGGQARSARGSWAPPVPSVVSAANPERDRRHMKSPLPGGKARSAWGGRGRRPYPRWSPRLEHLRKLRQAQILMQLNTQPDRNSSLEDPRGQLGGSQDSMNGRKDDPSRPVGQIVFGDDLQGPIKVPAVE